jgi:hypothetical protein
VEAISDRGIVGESAQISLSTPSCGQAVIIGKEKPDCLNNVPRVPDEPEDVVHSFIISSSNMTSRVSWSSPDSVTPITGYRVVWGQLLNIDQSNPTMDKSTAITKVLPKNVRTLNIGNLQEGTTYLVRVQALSKMGAGRIASVQFTTPLLQIKPIDPPYKEIGPSGDRRPDFKRRQEVAVLTSLPSHGGLLLRDRTTMRLQQTKWTVSSSSSHRLLNSSLLTVSVQFVLLLLNTLVCYRNV